jgi:hypothetical protein
VITVNKTGTPLKGQQNSQPNYSMKSQSSLNPRVLNEETN